MYKNKVMLKTIFIIVFVFLSCFCLASIGKENNGHWIFTDKKTFYQYKRMETQSDKLYFAGNVSEAIKILEKMEKKYPKVYETYSKLSYLRWSQAVDYRVKKDNKNYKKFYSLALNEGKKYRKIMPHDPDRGNIEALVYLGEKQWTECAQIVSEVLNRKYHGKPSLQTYALVCVAYEKLGDKKNSIYWLEKAVKVYPSYQLGKNKLATLKN